MGKNFIYFYMHNLESALERQPFYNQSNYYSAISTAAATVTTIATTDQPTKAGL